MTNPIHHEMSCDEFAERLADFLERDVPESVRAAMETHAVSCAECGALLADLRRLRLDAANLEELVPSRDLWAGISKRIEAPVVPLGRQVDGWTGRRQLRSRLWAGLAAAGLVAITATATYRITKQSMSKPVQPAAIVVAKAPVDSAPKATLSSPPAKAPAVNPSTRQPVNPSTRLPATSSLASNKLSAEQTYSLEIGRLRRIVNSRRSELDSSTVVVLEKNLQIIDQAIAQCRLALKKDPASNYLNSSLNEALDSKVQLLRTAVGLPARM